MPAMRLQKVIAQAGVASRRRAESLITRGHVVVNGHRITTLGTVVDPSVDVVVVDGHPLRSPAPLQYILLHKPRGYVTTCDDDEGRPTIMHLLKRQFTRLFPVGRLDVNTEGLLLLTNDGPLANRLLHPRYQVPRTYLVHVLGVVSAEDIAHLQEGVGLDDGKTLPAQVHIVKRSDRQCWLQITLREGRQRQIHRMLERCGNHSVKKLQRIAMGSLTLTGLAPGTYRPLEPSEIIRLRRLCHLDERHA
jgi:23S rRNA pseudouridine2605 synthase